MPKEARLQPSARKTEEEDKGKEEDKRRRKEERRARKEEERQRGARLKLDAWISGDTVYTVPAGGLKVGGSTHLISGGSVVTGPARWIGVTKQPSRPLTEQDVTATRPISGPRATVLATRQLDSGATVIVVTPALPRCPTDFIDACYAWARTALLFDCQQAPVAATTTIELEFGA